nr:hypothetical protein [Aeromonas sp. HMWF016]
MKDKDLSPNEAWSAGVLEHIASQSGRIKGCPKGSFLGLCSADRVIGINPGNYTRSIYNRDYAITAVEILKQSEHKMSAPELWDRVMAVHEKNIVSNHQMEVVLALWDKGMIR